MDSLFLETAVVGSQKPFNVPLLDFSSGKSVLLWGPSGIGKTAYVRSHFSKPLCCNGLKQLLRLTSDNDGIIFDWADFTEVRSFHWMPLLEPGDKTVYVTPRKFLRIPASLPIVFVHVVKDFFFDSSSKDKLFVSLLRQFVDERLMVYHVSDQLF
jgi:hypothetical protein